MGRWNRTCFYRSDPQRLSLCGSLWVAEGLCKSFSCVSIWSFTIFFSLFQNCATLSDPQTPGKDPKRLYGNQALVISPILLSLLGDLATKDNAIQTKENAIWTNEKTTLLLNVWPRTITETMATATKFMKFSCQINCFVFVIILVWQTVHSSAMTQITANLMEKTLQLTRYPNFSLCSLFK